jgi:translation elongation factor EF-G
MSTTTQDVLGSILRLIQLRRIKATKMDIKGKIIHIKAEIPIYEITTVELKMSRA